MVKTKQRVIDHGEVFTPQPIVKRICDLLPDECFKPETTFIEPGCGEGAFLLEIIARKIDYCLGTYSIHSNIDQLRSDIGVAVNSISGVDIQQDNVKTARKVIRECILNTEVDWAFRDHQELYAYLIQYVDSALERNIIQQDFLDVHAKLNRTNFDVVIGNPPYQMANGGFGRAASPIYPAFVQKANTLNPKYIAMIIPARWYSEGLGCGVFRAMMLTDPCLTTLVDFVRSREIFPQVDIKGGVCYFLWDRDKMFRQHSIKFTSVHRGKETECILDPLEFDILIRFPQALPILRRLRALNWLPLSIKVLPVDPFGLQTNCKLTDTGCLCYHRHGVGHVETFTDKFGILNKWKVVTPKAACSGLGNNNTPQQIIGRVFIVPPIAVCTGTFVIVDTFDTQEEAEKLVTYLKKPIIRFLIGLRKNSQQVTCNKFYYVPYGEAWLDMSDEDWIQTLHLTKEEQEFIASLVAPMP
jgi:site-specific DNA-methyltransferase (adenine-specific)